MAVVWRLPTVVVNGAQRGYLTVGRIGGCVAVGARGVAFGVGARGIALCVGASGIGANGLSGANGL